MVKMLLYLLFILITTNKSVSTKDPETVLFEKIFDDYGELERRVRPKPVDGSLVNVHLGMELYQVIEVNEREENLKLSVWVHMEWLDSRLSWNLSEYKNVKKINVKPGEVWTPDLVLLNSVDNEKLHMNKMETDIRVDHEGKLWWSSPMVVETRCTIDVEEFPFDKQHCYLRFSSWTHSIDRMNVTGEEVDIRYYSENQEWKLLGTETLSEVTIYPDGVYADVTFRLELQRRSMFYTINLIFPIVLITLLAMLTFLLPSESGERMGVSVTLMLTVTVFMLLITDMIPESSLHMAIVEIFFVFCLILIILVIVATIFISRIYNRASTDPPMSDWTRKYILGKVSYMVFARHDARRHAKKKGRDSRIGNSNYAQNDENGVGDINGDLSPPNMMEERANYREIVEKDEDQVYTMEEEWAIVGKTCDHCLFVIFILTFIIGTLSCFVHVQYIH